MSTHTVSAADVVYGGTSLVAHVTVADKQATQFMQSADVFESWKVIGKSFDITGKYAAGETPTTVSAKLRAAFAKSGTPVIALRIAGVEDGAWFDRNVRAISNGTSWLPMNHFLHNNHFPRGLVDDATNALGESPSRF